MNTFTITLTDAEYKALAHVAFDPQEWIDGAVKNRCRSAMEEIFNAEVARMLADPTVTEIPADREVVVSAANVKTAVEIHQERMIPVVETPPGPPVDYQQ